MSVEEKSEEGIGRRRVGSGGDYGYTQSLIKKRGPWVFVVSGDGSSCLGRLKNTACLPRLVRPVGPVSLHKIFEVISGEKCGGWRTIRRYSAVFLSLVSHLVTLKEPYVGYILH